MSSRVLKVALVIAVAATAAYWHWSPYLAMYSMKSAAEKKDADAFNEYVDYGKLRESLKGQFAAFMADKVGAPSSTGSGAAQAGAALGSMLAMAFADKFIDAMVRPEFVMKTMNDAKVSIKPGEGAKAEGEGKPAVKWDYERKSINRLVAYGSNPSKPDDAKIGFVFDRSGFASWKLSEIRLPNAKQ